MRNWERLGVEAKPRFQNMYGKKNSKQVVWIDNFRRGDWAVVIGDEIAPNKYKERKVYSITSRKPDAIEMMRYYMKIHSGKAKLSKVV